MPAKRARAYWVKRALAAFAALVVVSVAPRSARAEAPDLGNAPYEWKYLFPIWGDKLAQKGIRFPKPFGIGLNLLEIRQDIEIRNVEIAVNDGKYVDLSEIVKFGKTRSKIDGGNLRFDLWVLPFLNVYGLANYVIDSDTEVHLTEPFPLAAGASQTGYGGGFGSTVAFGFWGFFGTFDMNFTWNKVEKLDAPVRTFVFAPRVGKRIHLGGPVHVAGWVGAMKQAIEADTSGSINLSEAVGGSNEGAVEGKIQDWYEGLGPIEQAIVSEIGERFPDRGDTVIHYKLDKALADPWNLLFGMEADFSQEFQIRTEFGFLGRTQFLFSVNYRFGLILK